jgi:hypothetical protein
MVANAAGDSASLAAWTERSARLGGYFGVEFSTAKVVGRAAAAGLRARYRELITDSTPTRSLLATRDEDHGRRRADAARTLLALGRQLAAVGDTASARDTLALASDLARGMCGGAFVDSIRIQTLRSFGDSAEATRLASAPRSTGKCGRDWRLH